MEHTSTTSGNRGPEVFDDTDDTNLLPHGDALINNVSNAGEIGGQRRRIAAVPAPLRGNRHGAASLSRVWFAAGQTVSCLAQLHDSYCLNPFGFHASKTGVMYVCTLPHSAFINGVNCFALIRRADGSQSDASWTLNPV